MEVVVLAGGVAAAGEAALLAPVRAHVKRLGWTCLPTREDRVVLAAAGAHAGAIGAAKAARDAAAGRARPPTAPVVLAALVALAAAAAAARRRYL